MPKLIRVTTVDLSLHVLLEGQLGFLNREFEVVGVAADTGLLKAVGDREGIRVIDVPMHREIALWSDIKCLGRLVKIFRKEKPFIVHSNTPKGSLLSMIAAKFTGVPNRIYLVTGLRFQGEKAAKRWLLKTMERIACSCATKVIPEGLGVKKTLIEEGITRKPLEVVHNGNINGIDMAYYSPQACPRSREEMRLELGLGEDDFAFVFIGRIVGDKGMNELAEILRCAQDDKGGTHDDKGGTHDGKCGTHDGKVGALSGKCKLILVGPFESELDPLEDGNEKFFRTSGNVRYVGYQSDVRPYLLAADALVFPSYREGFPNVVIQAGAMGLPSIVTDINGCNEIIIEGENGRIIPPRDKEALGNMMAWFAEHPSEVARMAANAREMIASRYDRQDVWNALLEMYKSL